MLISFRTPWLATMFALSLTLPYVAHAHDKPAATASPIIGKEDRMMQGQAAKAGAIAGTLPEVFEDSRTNTVHFVINGKDILTIDASGIHVRGNVTYSGIAAHEGKSSGASPATTRPKPR
jgi:hypothetical protein